MRSGIDVPLVIPRPARGALLASLGALLAIGAACGPKVHETPSESPAPAPLVEPSAVAGQEPPMARALDPDPDADACSGYAVDGVAIGMARSAVERTVPLLRVRPEDSTIKGLEERTFAFRAARPGRVDDVQVGLSAPPDSVVEHVRAHILVAERDPWPRILFDRLGEPKNARVGEWIWWDTTCGTTLRLTRLDALGEGRGDSYTLEVRRTAKPGG